MDLLVELHYYRDSDDRWVDSDKPEDWAILLFCFLLGSFDIGLVNYFDIVLVDYVVLLALRDVFFSFFFSSF